MQPLRLASLLLAAAAPVSAQEKGAPLGAEFVDALVADCEAFAADPAGIAQSSGQGPSAMVMIAPDQSMVMINASAEKDGLFVTTFFSATDLPQGRVIACARSGYSPPGEAERDSAPLYDLIKGRAAEILGGPVAEVGGPIFQRGDQGRLGYWALDGLPPRGSIFLTLGRGAVSLSILTTKEPGAKAPG